MWLACSGSLIPNILAEDETGPDAAYGTVAHAVTETWLRTGRRPAHMIGEEFYIGTPGKGHLVEVDEEMLYHASRCVDRSEWTPGEQFIEYRVDFSHLTPIPKQGGTLDFAALRPKIAVLDDHKFGSSPDNIVYAEENSQLMIYAIGVDRRFHAQYGFKEYVLRINQPRLDHFDEWAVKRSRLLEFADYVRERAAAAWRVDAPRTPGIKQCRFCKVRGSCAANAKFQEDLFGAAFQDETQTVQQMQDFTRRLDDDLEPFKMHMAKVGSLTTAQMAKLLPYRAMAEAWWKALEEELNKRAVDGDMPPEMKFVEGRTRRKFISDERAVEHLEFLGLEPDETRKIKVISPAQAEKKLLALGYKRAQLPTLLQGLVIKPPGKSTLVPLSDRRPAVEDVTKLVFVDETTETEED